MYTWEEKIMNDVILEGKNLPFTIRWAKWKQNAKIVEKWEIVRNGLVNMFVMLVTMIDNAEIEYLCYNPHKEKKRNQILLTWTFSLLLPSGLFLCTISKSKWNQIYGKFSIEWDLNSKSKSLPLHFPLKNGTKMILI